MKASLSFRLMVILLCVVAAMETVSIGVVTSSYTKDFGIIQTQFEQIVAEATSRLRGELKIQVTLVQLQTDNISILTSQLADLRVIAVLDAVYSSQLAYTVQKASENLGIVHIELYEEDLATRKSKWTLPGQLIVQDHAEASQTLLKSLNFTQIVLATASSTAGIHFRQLMSQYPSLTITTELFVSDIFLSVLS